MKIFAVPALVATLFMFACASGSNRAASPTDTTGSRMSQGLDTSTHDSSAYRHTASNSATTPQQSVTGSQSGPNLTGDVTQDTSAVNKAPLNTSPSAENGLPPDGGALVQKKQTPITKKTKPVKPQ